jgi:hypothetical protein
VTIETWVGVGAVVAIFLWIWWEAAHPMPEPRNGPDGTYRRDEDGYSS